jgi:lysophospholipase L1-like esterase
MSKPASLKRLIVPLILSLGLSGCFTLRQGTFAAPTLAEVGPVLDNYGEAVVPAHGLIVARGDDLIYGVGLRSRRSGANGSSVARTRVTVTETLRQALKRVTIVNEGYPGDTVISSAQRWADAPAANLLILSYGYGDAEAKTPLPDYESALRDMVRRAHARGAAVFLIPTPPMAVTPTAVGKTPRTPPALVNAAIEPYRAVMRMVGQEENAEVFEPQAEITRIKATPTRTIAQTPDIYQAIAAGLVPYIRIVQPARPS